MERIETDYLVVGAGATGMAFTDTLVAETDARVVLVDRGHAPGGHWTSAYPFVRLHQPSAYYGVNSRALGSDTIDRVGWNEGLYELATVGEVCAYFDQVMHQDLLPSGQVSYFAMAEYLGEGRFHTLAGDDYTVDVRRRIVERYLSQNGGAVDASAALSRRRRSRLRRAERPTGRGGRPPAIRRRRRG